MKKILTTIAHENLSPVEDDAIVKYQNSGAQALNGIFHDEGVPGDTHAMIAWSFADDEKFYTFTGKDVFFKTVVRAYAEHRPLVLSPDMIWVLISQGFARYVNAHPEQLRDQLVNHSGKMDLVVQSDKDLLSGDADWQKLMADFTAQINDATKGDIAKTITADFTTTGITERITSQITLMETMKSYFDYVVHYIACGIPSVTLTGTPEDWQKVLEKTQQLEKYAVGPWTKRLVPILTEFVKASEGKADQAFWQSMVKKGRLDKLVGGGCDFRKPTKLDGWILKFFPDENGQTPDQVPHTHKMPSERVYVDFKYKVISPADGTVLTDIPMQLVAGFIGTEVDTQTHALTPKMGWVVRQMEGSDSIVKRLQKMDSEASLFGIELRVNKVPEHLSLLPHIKRLFLHFTDKVELPEWFYHLQIDNLRIDGEMTDEPINVPYAAPDRFLFPRLAWAPDGALWTFHIANLIVQMGRITFFGTEEPEPEYGGLFPCEEVISAIAVDKDGDIWFSCKGVCGAFGIGRFSKETGMSIPILKTSNHNIYGSAFSSIIFDSNGNRWFASNNGMVCFDKSETLTLYELRGTKSDICQLPDGRFLVSNGKDL